MDLGKGGGQTLLGKEGRQPVAGCASEVTCVIFVEAVCCGQFWEFISSFKISGTLSYVESVQRELFKLDSFHGLELMDLLTSNRGLQPRVLNLRF